MKQISMLDRMLLSGAGMLAVYQIVAGVEGLPGLPQAAYTIAFGLLLVGGLLMTMLGFEILDHPMVAGTAMLIPLCLAVGLVAEYYPRFGSIFIFLSAAGILMALISQSRLSRKTAAAAPTLVHGLSALLIFVLPLGLILSSRSGLGLLLVALGGGLLGIGGLVLAARKSGNPIIASDSILTLMPVLFFLMTAVFVAGFWLA